MVLKQYTIITTYQTNSIHQTNHSTHWKMVNAIYTMDEIMELMKETMYCHHVLDLESIAFMHEGAGTEVWGVDEAVGSLVHESGWTITGVVTWDYYSFCETFTATHADHGAVWSRKMNEFDYECIKASSTDAFDHFWQHHGESFRVCDLLDI